MSDHQVRFTVFRDAGCILSYCTAAQFGSPTFGDRGPQASRFDSEASLKDRLRKVGLPEGIANFMTPPTAVYTATDEQLSTLGFGATPGK